MSEHLSPLEAMAEPDYPWSGSDGCQECGMTAEVARVAAEEHETLALIVEHRIALAPDGGGMWQARASGSLYIGQAMTIGDAVRKCVARIKA